MIKIEAQSSILEFMLFKSYVTSLLKFHSLHLSRQPSPAKQIPHAYFRIAVSD